MAVALYNQKVGPYILWIKEREALVHWMAQERQIYFSKDVARLFVSLAAATILLANSVEIMERTGKIIMNYENNLRA